MVRDLVKTLIGRLDKESLSVTFPKVLDQMSGSDASFEMSASNTIKPMQMFYDHNIATHKYGLVLVNTTINNNGKNLPWKNAAQNGTDASNMLKVTFGFNDVVVLTDATKDQIIAAYDTLQKKVDTFESNKKRKETALCAVFWIGHTWYGLGHHRQYNVSPPDSPPGQCADGSTCPKTFGVTKGGDLINNYEYVSRLCKGDNTHVLYVLDWFSLHLGQLNAGHINKDKNWWELKLDNHRGWCRLNAVNTGIGELCQYFRQQKDYHDQHVYMFPFHLDAGEFNPTTWRTVAVPEQVIIDQRTSIMKNLIKRNESVRTLKNMYEVWEDRPKLEASEVVKSGGIFNQCIDFLKD